jgi:large subunit ribosomal protein L30
MSGNKQIKITLVRSLIGHPQDQRNTARALRLTKRGRTVVHNDNPRIFVWVKDVDTILATVEKCKEVLQTGH